MTVQDDLGLGPSPFLFGNNFSELKGSLAEALLFGKEEDVVVLAGSKVSVDIGGLRRLLLRIHNVTPAQYYDLKPTEQDRISDRLRRIVEKRYREEYPKQWKKLISGGYAAEEQMRQARHRLHCELVSWSRGKLALERPQGSSLHHLLEYDRTHTEGSFAEVLGECQIFVVENDWAKIGLPPGEWRLPFEVCCWEFRITGVRVLAFTDASRDLEYPMLWCVYGRDGHWVVDDYHYVLGSDGITGRVMTGDNDNADKAVEFPDVARKCFDEIRASCVMMDAKVCHQEHHAAPAPLVKRAVREKRQPPMDYMVVRLLSSERRAHHHSRPKIAVASSRAPQRGHWRRGTWVHFDDQDSGEVQYANDGGFVVSKTWRRWHFAGDPNNILEREYRL